LNWWFCLAVKGETDQEMAGFMDAARCTKVLRGTHRRQCCQLAVRANCPMLTPLLAAAAVAREGLPVLIHGTAWSNFFHKRA
jgi:anthranilate phosphoribosyltransferase